MNVKLILAQLVFGIFLFLMSISSSNAALIIDEEFDVGTSSTAETLEILSSWELLGTTDLSVANGRLEFQPQGPRVLNGIISKEAFSGNIELVANSGKTNTSGGFHVGILVGTNYVVFHPGLGNEFIQGHFRYEKWDDLLGFLTIDGPNLDMGFTPRELASHNVNIKVNSLTGEALVKITDGEDDQNIFEYSFTDVALKNEFKIGFATHGYKNEGTVFVDDIRISSVSAPATLALFSLGLIGLASRRFKKQS